MAPAAKPRPAMARQRKPANAPAAAGLPGAATVLGHRIERATGADLAGILALERLCFEPHRLASAGSLRRSLQSPRQSVWLVRDAALDPPLAGLLILWHFPRMLRVYDVASHPGARGSGVGYALMQHAERLAAMAGCARVQLEADPTALGLVAWYQRQGYAITARLPRFYVGGNDAVRMAKPVAPARVRPPSREAGPGKGTGARRAKPRAGRR